MFAYGTTKTLRFILLVKNAAQAGGQDKPKWWNPRFEFLQNFYSCSKLGCGSL